MKITQSLLAQIKEILSFKTIHSKIVIIYMLFSIVLFFFLNLTVNYTITRLEKNMMSQRLASDINYMEDLLSNDHSARWKIVNGEIYFGDVLIGDGTDAKANLAPFFELEKKTGTFSYVFMLDKEAKLSYVEGTETSSGYKQGHYLRVAGSAKSPDGKSIVGTYIAKNVADALDEKWTYLGEANVAGVRIFSLYNALFDEKGDIVGAMVVGRNITELKAQTSNSARKISYAMLFILVACGLFMIFLTSKWTRAIKVISDYLKQIENGNIPEQKLSLSTQDEMSLIAESVNRMVASLEENTNLRRKSETDALTKLPNRFALYAYVKDICAHLIEKPQTLAIEILDIDFFKQYNDNYGHMAGDKCLYKVAKQIYTLRNEHENVFVSRYGGDEFVIIYHGYLKDEIEEMVIELRQKILNCKIEHKYSQVSDIVTITQGVCFGLFDGNCTIEECFDQADKALYDVKKITRNNYNIVEFKRPQYSDAGNVDIE